MYTKYQHAIFGPYTYHVFWNARLCSPQEPQPAVHPIYEGEITLEGLNDAIQHVLGDLMQLSQNIALIQDVQDEIYGHRSDIDAIHECVEDTELSRETHDKLIQENKGKIIELQRVIAEVRAFASGCFDNSTRMDDEINTVRADVESCLGGY